MTWRACFAVLALAGTALGVEPTTPNGSLTFEQHVRPILKAHCFTCHGEGDELQGNLDVRLQRSLLRGGDSGAALAPGDAAASLMLQRVQKGEMPPGDKKLSPAEVETLAHWIAGGALTARPEPEQLGPGADVTPEERAFWSFQPVRPVAVPGVAQPALLRTPIDAFLLARLEAAGLTFSPEAEKRVLLRRACLDLVGLPPTLDQLAQFLADKSPDAYERLIDRLLASPHYAERWARHWLDVAGYADSDGYTNEDPQRPYAYKYRDYVIRSLAQDKPSDQFLQEQLAGDELAPQPYALSPDVQEKLIATGFLRMGPDGTGAGGVDQDLARNQVVAETVKIVSTAILGLSVGCAQCHNHRYDPISQTDYYRLRALFEPAYDWKNWRPPQARLISLYTDADRSQAAAVEAEAALVDQQRTQKQDEYIARTFEAELAKLPEDIRAAVREAQTAPTDKRTPEQQQLLKEYPSVNVSAGSLYLYDPKAAEELKALSDQAAGIRAKKPVEDFLSVLTETPGVTPATYLFSRGDHQQPRQAVPPGELTVIDLLNPREIPLDDPALPTTGRRLAYARRLTDGEHPLVARVLVNRIWMHHFGRGIVATAGEFGALGARPTHPELLDWLAADFVSGGWRLKRLHRMLMTSTAYRQASARDGAREAVDPDNQLYSRMPVRRLEAEALRDSVLAVSGKLNARQFGPPVPVMEDEVGQIVVGIENLNGENRPGPEIPLHGDEFRRSVYVQARRSRPLAVLDAFDLPAMTPNCEVRNASTVTPQSLLLMNSQFMLDQAGYFADRVKAEAGGDPAAQIAHAWRLALTQEPTADDVAAASAYLTEQTQFFQAAAATLATATPTTPPPPTPPATAEGQPAPDPAQQALATFCQALLSSNAFLYSD